MVRIRHAWSEILAEMGLELPTGFTEDRLADHRFLSAFQNGEMSENDFLVGLALEFEMTLEQVWMAHGLILREEYSGALQLVNDIQAAGTRVFCLSNTNALHYREFFDGRFPVCDAFDELLASQKLGLSKPDPRIYKYVEDHAGVQAGEIVFFDDNLPNVEGARACGWMAELVDPEGDPPGAIRQELVRLGVLPH